METISEAKGSEQRGLLTPRLRVQGWGGQSNTHMWGPGQVSPSLSLLC